MSEAWVKPLLLGVEAPVEFGLDGALGALLARLNEQPNAALAFSRGVGALAACTLAAVTLATVGEPAPAPAADDPRALADRHPWSAALKSVFAPDTATPSYETRLRVEACRQLARIGANLPFGVLPTALDAGQRSQALRPCLLPVLGTRGRWLAERNPDWKFAASSIAADAGTEADARVWQEGSHTDRLAYFRRLRARDPAAARELLQSGLAELAAKDRLDFVAIVGENLEPADEALLAPLLKDRGREVRASAALLLARLPASAHAQRLQQWIAPLVTSRRGLLGKTWECEAPPTADPEWAGAAIEAKRPQHESLGERAWWLYQLVRQVPLSWWTAHTGMTPAQLLAWAGKSDWKDALLRGWRERVGAHEPEWIEALLALRSRELRAHAAELLALLPAAQRERHWPGTIEALVKDGVLGDVIDSCALGETLSAAYSRPLLASLLDCFADDRLRHDYGLRTSVLELATLLHPDSLRGVAPPARRADETPAMAHCAHEFERIVRVRTLLHSSP